MERVRLGKASKKKEREKQKAVVERDDAQQSLALVAKQCPAFARAVGFSGPRQRIHPDKMTVGQCDVLLRLAFEQKHISNFGMKEVRLRAWVHECHTILQEQAGPTMHSIQLYSPVDILTIPRTCAFFMMPCLVRVRV